MYGSAAASPEAPGATEHMHDADSSWRTYK